MCDLLIFIAAILNALILSLFAIWIIHDDKENKCNRSIYERENLVPTYILNYWILWIFWFILLTWLFIYIIYLLWKNKISF